MRSTPSWLVTEPCTDVDLGVIKTGKEAQVNLVHRTGADGRVCQFARKRYLPREVTSKGQLEQLGVQRASAFVNDVWRLNGKVSFNLGVRFDKNDGKDSVGLVPAKDVDTLEMLDARLQMEAARRMLEDEMKRAGD